MVWLLLEERHDADDGDDDVQVFALLKVTVWKHGPLKHNQDELWESTSTTYTLTTED